MVLMSILPTGCPGENGGRAYCSDPYEIKLVQGHLELAVQNIINLCKGDMPASFPSCSLLGS